MADQQQSPGLLANILAVAGFIILILIIVWGAYSLLRLTGSGFSNVFSGFGGGDDITITVPDAPVQTGRTFPLSWQYEPSEEGSYALLYQCKTGFRFDMRVGNGPVAAIPCGNAYGVGTVTSLSLTPVLTSTSTIEVPLTVVFMPAATSTEERPQGTATITIAPKDAVTISTAPASQAPSSTSTQTTHTSSADLSVRIIAVGVIDAASGVFVERTPSNPNDIAAVQFDVKNNGGTASGAYTFSVQLPTQPVYPFISAEQASLAPGAHVVSTLRFGPLAPGGGTVAIEVDAKRAVTDANRSNNTTAIWMNASSYPYYYQAPFVY